RHTRFSRDWSSDVCSSDLASTVLADEIKDVPTTSFEDALRGKVAGMSVTSTSGQAGSTSSIRIRGIGSMNASNEPLYVIDGVPRSEERRVGKECMSRWVRR